MFHVFHQLKACFYRVPSVFHRVPNLILGTWNTPWNMPNNAVTSGNPWNTFQTNPPPGTQPPPGAVGNSASIAPGEVSETGHHDWKEPHQLDFTTPSPEYRTTPEERLTAFLVSDLQRHYPNHEGKMMPYARQLARELTRYARRLELEEGS